MDQDLQKVFDEQNALLEELNQVLLNVNIELTIQAAALLESKKILEELVTSL